MSRKKCPAFHNNILNYWFLVSVTVLFLSSYSFLLISPKAYRLSRISIAESEALIWWIFMSRESNPHIIEPFRLLIMLFLEFSILFDIGCFRWATYFHHFFHHAAFHSATISRTVMARKALAHFFKHFFKILRVTTSKVSTFAFSFFCFHFKSTYNFDVLKKCFVLI